MDTNHLQLQLHAITAITMDQEHRNYKSAK